jgi:hypothetical protein
MAPYANKKRKRGRGHQEEPPFEKDEELRKLVASILTIIRREGKAAKKHEVQKLVKRLKQLRDADKPQESADEGVDVPPTITKTEDAVIGMEETEKLAPTSQHAKSQRKIEKLEVKLASAKAFEVATLTKLCMKRLGMMMLGVDIDAEVEKERLKFARMLEKGVKRAKIAETTATPAPEAAENSTSSDIAEALPLQNAAKDGNNDDKETTEILLTHKNLIKAMDSLDERVTFYRRTVMREQGENIPSEAKLKKQGAGYYQEKWSKQKQTKSQPLSSFNNAGSSRFLDSLSGKQPFEKFVAPNPYGPGADHEEFLAPKRNRMGQRGRRAKMMAEESKKTGRQYESLNWRPKKENDESNNDQANTNTSFKRKSTNRGTTDSGIPIAKKVNAAEVADMGKKWKEDGKAHPSWAAKQHAKQQSGIASFAGKKITF